MRAIMKWLLAPSGAESCDYLARLEAVPANRAREDRRAA